LTAKLGAHRFERAAPGSFRGTEPIAIGVLSRDMPIDESRYPVATNSQLNDPNIPDSNV
jgi:hypothetical protein